MLVENSIPGHVEYERVSKSEAPVKPFVYRVADVLIQIRNVEFVGAGEAELPALTAASRRVFDREYSRTILRSLIEKQLLPVYYSRGNLKASFGDPQPKVVKQPSAANDEGPRNLTIVDVSFPVTPGQQYKLKSLLWSGNEAIPTDTLAKMVRLEPGHAANMVRLGDSLAEIQKLYGSKGYVTASITPQPSFDDAAGTVAITLEVKEGPVFHMGDLEFRGLDNGLTAKLRNAWKIRPGEIYNSTYLSEYLPARPKTPAINARLGSFSPCHTQRAGQNRRRGLDLHGESAQVVGSSCRLVRILEQNFSPCRGGPKTRYSSDSHVSWSLNFARALPHPSGHNEAGCAPAHPAFLNSILVTLSAMGHLLCRWNIAERELRVPHGSRDQACELKKENLDECSKHENGIDSEAVAGSYFGSWRRVCRQRKILHRHRQRLDVRRQACHARR